MEEMTLDIREEENTFVKELFEKVEIEVKKVIVEQDDMFMMSMTSLFAGGHVLLEGVPGLAKTLMVRTIARTMDFDFNKIQFTPDLMPSDVTGTKIYNMQTREFELKKGPVFTNFLLADEINRTPPKTQSGLLEAMEERSVSIDVETEKLPFPYMVFATQNPIEYEGTYPLPEALLDRFLMKLNVEYPSVETEISILKKHHQGFSNIDLDKSDIKAVCSAADIQKAQEIICDVTVNDEILEYIVEIINKTRTHTAIELGSSPRGTIAILKAAKAFASIDGRDFVIPEDVKEVAKYCLIHRVTLKPEVEIEGVRTIDIIEEILKKTSISTIKKQ